jgi:hypothetical protein
MAIDILHDVTHNIINRDTVHPPHVPNITGAADSLAKRTANSIGHLIADFTESGAESFVLALV